MHPSQNNSHNSSNTSQFWNFSVYFSSPAKLTVMQTKTFWKMTYNQMFRNHETHSHFQTSGKSRPSIIFHFELFFKKSQNSAFPYKMNSIFHHLLCFYSFFVLSTSTHSAIVNRTTIISSPRITDWGAWGPWSTCPNREYVYGFQLKTERNRGEFDDTGLNGIRLFCAKSGKNLKKNIIAGQQLILQLLNFC